MPTAGRTPTYCWRRWRCRRGSVCLSIASAGDNSLALLSCDPEIVAACDVNTSQLACVEIRQVAFSELSHADLLLFLGFREARDRSSTRARRLEIYRSLRSSLCSSSRRYFDGRRAGVAGGLVHNGKFERYLRFFRRWVLPLIHGRETVEALLEEKEEPARRAFYRGRWNTWRWRVACRVFCSRAVLGVGGRDPEFMRFVEGQVAERILRRAEVGLTALPTHDNPFLAYIGAGAFGRALPFYAREENFSRIRRNLSRLKLFHGSVTDLLRADSRGFDKFNLSDIFEYMGQELFLRTARALLEGARGSARIAYWNMLVPRSISAHVPEGVVPLRALSQRCFSRDKAFFYQAFHVDEVV